MAQSSQDYDHLLKLLLVGDSAVGKSSLVRAAIARAPPPLGRGF
jgi:GTPase SAR1 family protein